MNTSEHYSPFDLLPSPEPCTVLPPDGYFYDNVAKHLIKDTVRVMANGLPIDLDRVEELEVTLDATLATVQATLAQNPYIQHYVQSRHSKLVTDYIAERQTKVKLLKHFVKPFKYNDQTHRSYFMQIFAETQQISIPVDLLPTGIPKWPANTVKKLSASRPLLKKLLSGELPLTHPTISKAMTLLATHKCDLHNRKFLAQIAKPDLELPPFNPGSSKQKQGLFELLNIKSEAVSKTTGEPSWPRDQIERVNKETSDPSVKELTGTLIDYSFGAIIKQTFIPAFYRYTINGRLQGNLKLFGAKSFRYTSQAPNLLNMPSTKSIYAKSVKRCFTARPGFIVATADYSALENRVIANLSGDTNLSDIYLQGLDGHCMNSLYYFRDEIANQMPLTGNTTEDVRTYNTLRKTNKALDAIRQRGKPISFGLQYGAYPPKVAASIGCSLVAATAIFDSYHNDLYPSVTVFREEYVLPTATEQGRIHLGLGCYLKTDNPNRDIRTITNACSQFWSILTALTISKIHQAIDTANMQEEVIVTSTIYDSIYFEVRNTAKTIKWLNDTLITIMLQDFMPNQTVHNEANLDIGPSWADLTELPNNASLKHVSMQLELIAHKVSDTAIKNEKFISTYTIQKEKTISTPMSTIEEVLQWRKAQPQ